MKVPILYRVHDAAGRRRLKSFNPNGPPQMCCDRMADEYGGITDLEELRENLRQHCIPESILDDPEEDYDRFLEERRALMAAKVKNYFARL